MSEKKLVGFQLELKMADFIEDQKWVLRKTKSCLVNKMVKYFYENQDQLKEIVLEELT